RIDVKYLVLPVTSVVAETNVKNPLVPYLFHEILGSCFHDRVGQANSESSDTAMNWTLAYLLAREGGETVRLGVKVAIKHPDGVIAARYVLLQHKIRIGRVLQSVIPLQEL